MPRSRRAGRSESDNTLPGGEKAPGAVRYASARRLSVVEMAMTADATAAQSGKTVTSVRKDKEMHHHRQDFEAVIERLIDEQKVCAR